MKKSLITLCFASIAGAAFAGSEPAPVAAPIDSAKNPVLCVPEPENCFNAGEWTFETGIAGIFVDGDQAAGGAYVHDQAWQECPGKPARIIDSLVSSPRELDEPDHGTRIGWIDSRDSTGRESSRHHGNLD